MASINDYTFVKVLQNPIIPLRVAYIVKSSDFNSDLCTDYVPSSLSLQDGLWHFKINSIFVDNFLSKDNQDLPKIVVDIKTSLHHSYRKKPDADEELLKRYDSCQGHCLGRSNNFQSYYTTVMTAVVKDSGRFCFISNSSDIWYEVSSRPFSYFQARFELKEGIPALAATQTLRVEIEFTFQRIKWLARFQWWTKSI